MPTVLLVRHAQASFGTTDYDVLSARGREQVIALADALARRGTRTDRVVSGSLTRQLDTAAPIAAAAGTDVAVDARWNEYDSNHVMAQHSTSAARQERPGASNLPAVSSRDFQAGLDAALLAWIDSDPGHGPAESWDVFIARATGALAAVVAELESGETALVFTSGGIVAAICVALLGLPASAFVAFNRVSVNTGITKLAHGRSGTSLVSFNDHAHLERPGDRLITSR